MADRTRSTMRAAAVAAALFVEISAMGASRIKTDVPYRDKAFSFGGVHTWAWHPEGAGGVKMVLTADDDPEAMRARVEPTIKQAVQEALASRGLSMRGNGEAADLYVTYYVLLSAQSMAETAEMFGAATPDWALPPVAAQTTNFRVMEQGSLVLDVSAATTRAVVWRGVARAELDRSSSDPERRERLQQAVKDLLRKLPKP